MSKKLLVSDLSLEYKGKKGLSTLKNITFDLNVEEIGCILGPSGCGKTSLLRAIAGLEDISEGRIIVDGRCISTPTSRVPSNERSIGMVFQDYALFPNLNVEKNIAFSFNNKNQPDSQKKIKELLDLYDVDDDQIEQLKKTLNHSKYRLKTLNDQKKDVEDTINEMNQVISQLEKLLNDKGIDPEI